VASGARSRHANLLRLLALTLAAALGGCHPAPRLPPADWRSHRDDVESRERWELGARIGLRAGGKGDSAFLDWRQDADAYRLALSGALGMGRLVLHGEASGVSWRDDSGTEHHHADADALVEELWGWRIPLGALKYWVRGIPEPGVEFDQERFENGLAQRFRQAGWLVELADYRPVEGLALPRKVRISSDDAALTVAVHRWRLDATP